ncbi:MAG: hypothetical protein ACI9C1_001066 [Candidatus Aldehydirespiratoraceae bacterium]|jgi:hypothetical protein
MTPNPSTNNPATPDFLFIICDQLRADYLALV